MKIHDKVEQRTQEWFELRKGKITGSILKDMISQDTLQIKKFKTGAKKNMVIDGAMSCILKIIAQRYITYDSDDTMEFPSLPMIVQNRGGAGEQEAKLLYERRDFQVVNEVGFIESDCGNYGFSPDGLVGKDGFIEVKTINSGKHFSAKLNGIDEFLIKENYKTQIMLGFLVNPSFKWCDYMLYTGSFTNPKNRLSVFRILRNEEELLILEESISDLIDIINQTQKNINFI